MQVMKHRWSSPLLAALVAIVVGGLAESFSYAAEAPVVIDPPKFDQPKAAGALQTAVFGGGCFWGVQGVFEHVRGVQKVVSGYAGGNKATAQYELVATGTTGHAESVQITYDPAVVSYGELLRIFFSVAHDPTQLNRQGPDSGTQYRSVIFYGSEAQKSVAQAYITQLGQAHAYARQIVTQLSPAGGFYPAEDYHQDYLVQHPRDLYIVYNDLPKVANLQRLFPASWRGTPVSWR
ncbi:peptide-methionine (S)-S-oxide reductase MsrA [Chitinimonas sp.]|uniref:peptide-methionine (S)-S-oxide reductase MsrA n=1 Tax=Chitinimonas sp. TaxID=1934313 RepID=UPI002F9553C3